MGLARHRSLVGMIPLAASIAVALSPVACGGANASRGGARAPNAAHPSAARPEVTSSAATAAPGGESGSGGGNDAAATAASGVTPRAPGPLNRAEVERLLAEGLGRFLARVAVSPVLAHGRFVGFRLDSAEDLPAWRAAGADIRVGDVILRVNGIRIERPEQALWAFERLRIASEISVDLLRGNAPVAIHSPILPDGHVPSSP